MNMNGLNLLAMLSGSVGQEDLDRFFPGEDSTGSEFAATLMAQIASITQSVSQDNASLPMTDLASVDAERMDAMQEIAALLGNKLPAAENFGQEIDLEETLNALREVLDHIEAVTAPATNSSGEVDWTDVDEAMPVSVNDETVPAVPIGALPLGNYDNPDETLMTGHTIEQPVVQDAETVITDGEENVPNLVKKLLQNGEELSNGKALIDQQRTTGDNKIPVDGKTIELHAKAEPKTANAEKNTDVAIVDKSVPKLAVDFAQLHRQFATQTKLEMPAMNKPMMHPEWDQELGERIVWMNNRAMPFAELRLNPQHLGPISIRIDMNQDQATIAFSAQQASVREAIEAAIPKLREMLGSQQLNLAEINVNQASISDQGKFAGFGQAAQQHNEGGQKNGRGSGSFANTENQLNSSEDIDNGNTIVSSGILNIFA